jgi:hypothetical protein
VSVWTLGGTRWAAPVTQRPSGSILQPRIGVHLGRYRLDRAGRTAAVRVEVAALLGPEAREEAPGAGEEILVDGRGGPGGPGGGESGGEEEGEGPAAEGGARHEGLPGERSAPAWMAAGAALL